MPIGTGASDTYILHEYSVRVRRSLTRIPEIEASPQRIFFLCSLRMAQKMVEAVLIVTSV